MKKRKGVLAFTIIEGILLAGVIALYIVGAFSLGNMPQFNFLFNLLTSVFSNPGNMFVFLPTVAVAGVTGLLFIIWLIVDIVRKRWLGFLYAVLFLLAGASLMLVYPYIMWVITNQHRMPDFLNILLGGLALSSFVIGIIYFIVDMATGKRIKAPKAPEAPKVEAPVEEEAKRENPLLREASEEKHPTEVINEEKEEVVIPQEDIDELNMEEEPQEKEDEKKKAAKKPSTRVTQTVKLTNENGQTYVKAYHVSRRADLNKWQVKATGSSRALKLFNTQKEAIDYANQLTAGTNIPVRVHSKAGKLRKTRN